MVDPKRGNFFERLVSRWAEGEYHSSFIGSVDASLNELLVFQLAQHPGCLGGSQSGFFGNIALAFAPLRQAAQYDGFIQ